MSYIMWIPPEMVGTKMELTKPDGSIQTIVMDWDPNGDWVTEDEFIEKMEKENLDPNELSMLWMMMLSNRPISDTAKGFIIDTLNGKLKWQFSWCWFTGGIWFPTFITMGEDGEYDLRAQIAWPPKEWGFIVVITGKGSTYDSIIDDEDIPQVGMEIWHLMEDNCTNRDVFVEEMQKRTEAHKRGEKYPPVEQENK